MKPEIVADFENEVGGWEDERRLPILGEYLRGLLEIDGKEEGEWYSAMGATLQGVDWSSWNLFTHNSSGWPEPWKGAHERMNAYHVLLGNLSY